MQSLLILLIQVLSIYSWVVIASVIMSWLTAFNIINYNNQIVRQISQVVSALTEPLLRPIRNALPSFGGLDLSPIVLLLGIFFLQNLIREYGFRAF